MRTGENLILTIAAVNLNSTGDVLTLRFPVPVQIVHWGVVATVAVVTNADLDAELDLSTHDSDGTPTRSDGSGGQNLIIDAAMVVGEVAYVQPTSAIIVRPGDFATFQISTGATSGNGIPWIEYQILPFQYDGQQAMYSGNASLRMTNSTVAI